MKRGILFICIAALAAGVLSCSLLTSAFESSDLHFTPDALPEGQAGQPYEAVITLSNQRTPAFNMSVKEESLPPGLAGRFDQDRQTYTLSGTLTQAGTYPLTITALCYGTNAPGQSGEKTYQLLIR